MKPRVLFRVAAGPRIGFGHLIRSRTVADALGVPHVVSLRGSRRAAETAARIGCRVLGGGIVPAVEAARPSLLVIDDPRPGAAAPWLRAARRLGIATASIHDLGLAACHSDLSIDGTILPGPMNLAGVRYAILDPRLRRVRAARRSPRPGPPVVLVAFGGGPRRHLAAAVARAIARRRPDAIVRVAGGFERNALALADASIVAVPPARGLGAELARATVAVLAGGVTLYEACAVGLPAIGVPIVRAQRPSVAGLARHGAIVNGGAVDSVTATAARVARIVDDLLDAPGRRQDLSLAARRLVDGRGAARVAAALTALVQPVSPRSVIA